MKGEHSVPPEQMYSPPGLQPKTSPRFTPESTHLEELEEGEVPTVVHLGVGAEVMIPLITRTRRWWGQRWIVSCLHKIRGYRVFPLSSDPGVDGQKLGSIHRPGTVVTPFQNGETGGTPIKILGTRGNIDGSTRRTRIDTYRVEGKKTEISYKGRNVLLQNLRDRLFLPSKSRG